MLKTLLILPDGREISSGTDAEASIVSSVLTQCVNDGQELSLGSACASMLEVSLCTPNGGLSLTAGDELIVYKVDGEGTRYLTGCFTTEKPTRPTANTMTITAYDRITWLDKDLSDWLAGLEGWPYTLLDFAGMVCKACGLTLVNDSLPNGGYLVQAFSARGITGRTLMQWVGEVAGRFCRATPNGGIEFAWYTPAAAVLTPGGERYYFQNGLAYEDYQVAPIEKVQLRLTEDDVGVVWPDETGEKNTYIISGNYLLTATDTASLQPVAQTLYEMLQGVTYTPCKVTLPAGTDIGAGETLQITDRNGKTFTAFVMTRTQRGQAQTLECTGSHRRDSTTVTNNEEYRVRNSRLLELRKQTEGLTVRVLQTETDLQSVTESVADVQMKSDEVSLRVSQLESSTSEALESVNETVQSLQKEVSAQITAEAVELQIQSALENGAAKVVTSTGFTFDDTGMTVEKSGSEMKTQITENGMTVSQNDEEVLTANNVGVNAKNLHATTYLIVGGRSRFENYGDSRTGCFWIGG